MLIRILVVIIEHKLNEEIVSGFTSLCI